MFAIQTERRVRRAACALLVWRAVTPALIAAPLGLWLAGAATPPPVAALAALAALWRGAEAALAHADRRPGRGACAPAAPPLSPALR